MNNFDLFGDLSSTELNNPNQNTESSDWLLDVLSNAENAGHDSKQISEKPLDAAAQKYRVLSDRLPDVIKILDKMVKTAEKKGFPLMHYSATEPFLIPDPNDRDELLSLSVADVIVHFPAFELGNYIVLGKLDHVSAETPLLSHVTDFSAIPDKFLQPNCPPNCDHCEQTRNRNTTWLFRHKDTGDVTQIGSSCVDEYTKYNSADAFLQYYNLLVDDLPRIFGAIDPFYEEGLSSGIPGYASARIILATTLSVMHREGTGYISSSKAYELGVTSTSDLVSNALFGKKKMINKLNISPFFEEADRIVEWEKNEGIPEKFKQSEYGHNQRALMRSGGADEKKIGIVVSLVAFYLSSLETKKRLESQGKSTNQGVEKEKITRILTCYNQYENSSQWGITTTKLYSDTEGNIYKYKSGSHNPLALKMVPYEAKMTVKSHEEYKGIAQTNITRVTFPALDAFEGFIESKDPKKFGKLLSAIPHDLHVKDFDGNVSHWFSYFLASNSGFRMHRTDSELIAEKIRSVFDHPAHTENALHYPVLTDDFIDNVLLLKVDSSAANGLIDVARNAGGLFYIEKEEGGVNNGNIITAVNSLCGRYLAEDFQYAQRYLAALARFYDEIPLINDAFAEKVAAYVNEQNSWANTNVTYNSALYIDADNRLVFVSSSTHDKADILFCEGSEIRHDVYHFGEDSPLYLEKPKNWVNSKERTYFALSQHNKQCSGSHSFVNGTSRIQAGSSGSFGSGFS